MIRFLVVILVIGALVGIVEGGSGSLACTPGGSPAPGSAQCKAEAAKEQREREEQPSYALTHNTPIKRRLMKAASHLPPGASVEEMMAQGERENGGR